MAKIYGGDSSNEETSHFYSGEMLFKKGAFDNSLAYLKRVNKESLTTDQKVHILTMKGFCHYQILQPNPLHHIYHPYSDDAVKNRFNRHEPQFTRNTKKALICLNKALEISPYCIQARYYRGLALKHEISITEAYLSLADTLQTCNFAGIKHHSNNYEFYKAAKQEFYTLFARYPELKFIQIKAHPSMKVAKVHTLLSSINPYSRLRACRHILTSNNPLEYIDPQKLRSLKGKKLLIFDIPFTGDLDSRVREVAHEIYNQLLTHSSNW